MYTRRSLLAGALAGVLAAQVAPALGAESCQALQERRDQLAQRAMQAEVALSQALRQRLCPDQEQRAARAQARAADPPADPRLERESGEGVDYGAYIRCRRQAEAELRRSRPVLYRNQRGFPYYAAAGATLARQADGLRSRLTVLCGPASP